MRFNICDNCGECCKKEKIAIDYEEYQKLLPFLSSPGVEQPNGLWRITSRKQVCKALGERGCLVPYSSRPIVCRMFPFVIDIKPSGSPVLARSLRCNRASSLDFKFLPPAEQEELALEVFEYVWILAFKSKKAAITTEQILQITSIAHRITNKFIDGGY